MKLVCMHACLLLWNESILPLFFIFSLARDSLINLNLYNIASIRKIHCLQKDDPIFYPINYNLIIMKKVVRDDGTFTHFTLLDNDKVLSELLSRSAALYFFQQAPCWQDGTHKSRSCNRQSEYYCFCGAVLSYFEEFGT